MKCPYCGNTDCSLFLAPKPLVSEASFEILKNLGLDVPYIQMCKACDATLNPAAFVPGSAKHMEACAARVH